MTATEEILLDVTLNAVAELFRSSSSGLKTTGVQQLIFGPLRLEHNMLFIVLGQRAKSDGRHTCGKM